MHRYPAHLHQAVRRQSLQREISQARGLQQERLGGAPPRGRLVVERSFAGGGWSPPKESGFLPKLISVSVVAAVFYLLFDYCGAGGVHGGSERNGGEHRVRYR
jgi:hypothetical protein